MSYFDDDEEFADVYNAEGEGEGDNDIEVVGGAETELNKQNHPNIEDCGLFSEVNNSDDGENENNYNVNDYDSNDDDDEDDNYTDDFSNANMMKIVDGVSNNALVDAHPECIVHNYDEVLKMTSIVRNDRGDIIDEFHRTIPFMTKYEKTRILGQRAKQLQYGATPFISDISSEIIDEHIIASMELKEKKIPFIIRRPLPNGGSEYWKVKDLEMIC